MTIQEALTKAEKEGIITTPSAKHSLFALVS